MLISNKLDGIGTFTHESFKLLTQQHPEVTFYFFFDRDFDQQFIYGKNVKGIVVPLPTRHPYLLWMWLNMMVPYYLKKYEIDLFISPDGFLPTNCKTKTLDIIHDLNFFHYPQKIRWGWGAFYNKHFPKYAQQATRIATVSEFSKTDIAQQYQIAKSKIDVVYNGANEGFQPITETEITSTRNKYSNGHPYFFFVGSMYERKNIKRLLQAFELFKTETNSDFKLLIAGRKIWWSNETEETYNNSKFKEEIIFTGRVDNASLHKLMGAAFALVYVSLFEGFGIPIVEAMQCSVPVITSNLTSMPEVAGDAALCVNPNSTEEICHAMKTIVDDKNLYQSLKEKGLERSKLFTWQRTADLIWQSIEKTIATKYTRSS